MGINHRNQHSRGTEGTGDGVIHRLSTTLGGKRVYRAYGKIQLTFHPLTLLCFFCKVSTCMLMVALTATIQFVLKSVHMQGRTGCPDAADGHFSAQTGGSSNGRTTVSGSVYRGSSPRPPAKCFLQYFL